MLKVVATADSVLNRHGEMLRRVGQAKARSALARSLNKAGNKARTQVRRSLVAQTGIKYGLISREVSTVRARPSNLVYDLVARGGETNLNLFGARQGKRGVSAAPWKKRRVFKRTFVVPAYGGRVYSRKTSKRWPLEAKFGPNIAREILKRPTSMHWHKGIEFLEVEVDRYLAHMFGK